jgi:hypothetical protein
MEQKNNHPKDKKSPFTEPGNPGIEKHDWPVGPIESTDTFDEDTRDQIEDETDKFADKNEDHNDPDQWSVSWP